MAHGADYWTFISEELPALALTYEEGPGGHDWEYWDQQIQRVLAWLPLEHHA